jgi:hypothetical protein
MWVLLPILLILVLLGMVGSLFAGVFWLVGSAWPWLLIGLGAWLFWHEDGQHRRYRRQPQWAAARPEPLRAAAGAAEKPGRGKPRTLRKAELPIDLQVKVEQIRRKVDVLLGYADRFPPFSQDLYLVRQTASEYLPRTVNAFLSLPAEAVDKPLHDGGQTAREELRSQLSLLDAKLDEIAQDLQRQDADRLLANRRFLESRFGQRDGSGKEPLSA